MTYLKSIFLGIIACVSLKSNTSEGRGRNKKRPKSKFVPFLTKFGVLLTVDEDDPKSFYECKSKSCNVQLGHFNFKGAIDLKRSI